VEHGKTIPMDGLALYMKNTWDKIRDQKELNLPDQRIMVANLRCGELKEEALQGVEEEVERLRRDSEKTLIEGFNARCTQVIKKAVTHFDEYGH